MDDAAPSSCTLALLVTLALSQTLFWLVRLLTVLDHLRAHRGMPQHPMKHTEHAVFAFGSLLLVGTTCYSATTRAHPALPKLAPILHVLALYSIRAALWLFNADHHRRIRDLCAAIDAVCVRASALGLAGCSVAAVALAGALPPTAATAQAVLGAAADVLVAVVPLCLPAPVIRSRLERCALPAMVVLGAASMAAGVAAAVELGTSAANVYAAAEGLALQAAYFSVAVKGFLARRRKGMSAAGLQQELRAT